jgi:hypothetical protein
MLLLYLHLIIIVVIQIYYLYFYFKSLKFIFHLKYYNYIINIKYG